MMHINDLSNHAPRWKCICTYDGTSFFGWQSQPNGLAIQDIIETNLALIFKKKIRIHGSSRTDRGVHAIQQVFHFDADWKYTPEILLKAVQNGLPLAIQMKSIELVDPSFHARYSAKSKRYCYYLSIDRYDPFESRFTWFIRTRRTDYLDLHRMQLATKVLIGKHDFSAFSAQRIHSSPKENPVKTLTCLELHSLGSKIKITTESSGYLYKMVRSLVGSLVAVGLNKLTIQELKEALLTKERHPLFETAPPHGLFLETIFY